MPAGSRRWGWHQLDASWADRLVAEAGVRPGQLVVDVGAGTGAVTTALVAARARVVAVELHHERATALRRRFPTHKVIVVEADAADLRLPRRAYRVVANPPYAITSPLLRRLLQPGTCSARPGAGRRSLSRMPRLARRTRRRTALDTW